MAAVYLHFLLAVIILATWAGHSITQAQTVCSAATTGGNSGGADCVFPFVYNGNTYTACTDVSLDQLWCATVSNYDEQRMWGLCITDCVAPSCPVPTTGGTGGGADCVFPFTFGGSEYNQCHRTGGVSDTPWCATTSNWDLDGLWGNCIIYTSRNNMPCVFPFTYEGNQYYECTTSGESEGPLWCGISSVIDTDSYDWGYCKLGGVCEGNYASTSQPAVTPTTFPSYNGCSGVCEGNYTSTSQPAVTPTTFPSYNGSYAVSIPVAVVLVALCGTGITVAALLWCRKRQQRLNGVIENEQPESELEYSDVRSPGTQEEGEYCTIHIPGETNHGTLTAEQKYVTSRLDASGETNLTFSTDVPYEKLYGKRAISGRPIKVKDVAAYIENMEVNPDMLKSEYMAIPSDVLTTSKVGHLSGTSYAVLGDQMGSQEQAHFSAFYIPGFWSQRAYIVTQIPAKNFVEEFWRLAYDHESRTLIVLNDFKDVTCAKYWPSESKKSLEYGSLVVDLINEKDDRDITLREYRITHTEEAGRSLTTLQFHVHGWKEGADIPPDADVILHLLERVKRRQGQTDGNSPIIIQCKSGIGHSGLLCAADVLLEKLKADQEVDVVLAVAQIRKARPQFINTLAQYRFLYELAMLYIQENNTEANYD